MIIFFLWFLVRLRFGGGGGYPAGIMESFGAAVIGLFLGLFPVPAVPMSQPVGQLAQATGSYVPNCTQKNQAKADSGDIKEQCLPGCQYTVRVVDGSVNVKAIRYRLPTETKFCWVRYCSTESETSCKTAESVDASKPKGMIISSPDTSDETAVSAPTVRIAGMSSPAYTNTIPSPQADPGYALNFNWREDPFRDARPIDPSQISPESNPFRGTPQSQNPAVDLNMFAGTQAAQEPSWGFYSSDSYKTPGATYVNTDQPGMISQISAPDLGPTPGNTGGASPGNPYFNSSPVANQTFNPVLSNQLVQPASQPRSQSFFSKIGSWFRSWF